MPQVSGLVFFQSHAWFVFSQVGASLYSSAAVNPSFFHPLATPSQIPTLFEQLLG